MTQMLIGTSFTILKGAVFIVAIFVLLKQFTHGGALQGILGIITCFFWTFIWGWIKHKSLEMTNLMVIWTVVWVLLVLIPTFGQ